MSRFERAWPVLKEHEGSRYTNYKWDPGGATKYGITLRTARAASGIDFDIDNDGDIDEHDIYLLDEPGAQVFYRQWWNKYRYGEIVDQQVATKAMDMSINVGPRRAHVWLQTAANACGYNLEVDGILGPKTLAAVNASESREFLLELCRIQTEHYRKWVDAKPEREVARIGLHRRGAWPFLEDTYVQAQQA